MQDLLSNSCSGAFVVQGQYSYSTFRSIFSG
jgi:hypothetical protein